MKLNEDMTAVQFQELNHRFESAYTNISKAEIKYLFDIKNSQKKKAWLDLKNKDRKHNQLARSKHLQSFINNSQTTNIDIKTFRTNYLIKNKIIFSEKEHSLIKQYENLFAATNFKIFNQSFPISRFNMVYRLPDQKLRKIALQGLAKSLNKVSQEFESIYKAILQERLSNTNNNLSNLILETESIPPEFISHLIDTIKTQAKDLISNYARTENCAENVFAAPVSSSKKISLNEAKENILSAFGQIDTMYQSEIERLFNEKSIHTAPSSSKRPGAFCYFLGTKIRPVISVHYDETLSSYLNLAHEIGHALHFIESSKNNSFLNTQASTTVSETISHISELICYKQLGIDSDFIIQRWWQKIFWNSLFICFENDLYNPQSLSKDINDNFLKHLEIFWGKDFSNKEYLKNLWVVIPQFFRKAYYSISYLVAAYSAAAALKAPSTLKTEFKRVLNGGAKINTYDLAWMSYTQMDPIELFTFLKSEL
ncbi:MAG: hypothetical protein H7A33_07600 [Deltaproteobacteria bacterium]|nr:hypothetical protein [Deltaproteobacteria bacterium]